MALAMLVGRGDRGLAERLGLRPIDDHREFWRLTHFSVKALAQ